MVSLQRLRMLDQLVRQIDGQGVLGDVVECGTYNGGSAAVLARVACRSPLNRHIWLLDSFAGMPPAGSRDGPAAAAYAGLCCGSLESVRTVLRKVSVPDHAVTAVPGWFQDTLPKFPVSKIALLHIDADWYDSVFICLDQLFDRVSPGGFIVLDDFGYWQGCREAWQDFQTLRGLSIPLIGVDGIGVYMQKPETPSAASSIIDPIYGEPHESVSPPRF
jgi:O-methyltransferase